MDCTLPDVCEKVNCLDRDVQEVWEKVFGVKESVFIATGNVGIPADVDLSGAPTKYAFDQTEYMRGAYAINKQNPKGLFLIGNSNYDSIDADTYNFVGQEAKIVSGFSQLLANRQVYPVMGELDYWPAQDTTGSIDAKMANTLLHMFPWLSDAKRYYSVYDDKTKTEFYVLSSGRYKNYYTPFQAGFVYADDILVGDDQYNWLIQRTAASPAKNKVVIFAEPFTSLPDSFQGTNSLGASHVFAYFDTWDFQSMGINLIINGHAGNSFHLKKSSINIVNASAFSRSRMSFTKLGSDAEPPVITSMYGVGGYAIEYYSHQPMAETLSNITRPAGVGYVVPKNEFFKMTASLEGIFCEFVSYDPYAGTNEAVVNSMVVEHSFNVEANS